MKILDIFVGLLSLLVPIAAGAVKPKKGLTGARLQDVYKVPIVKATIKPQSRAARNLFHRAPSTYDRFEISSVTVYVAKAFPFPDDDELARLGSIYDFCLTAYPDILRDDGAILLTLHGVEEPGPSFFQKHVQSITESPEFLDKYYTFKNTDNTCMQKTTSRWMENVHYCGRPSTKQRSFSSCIESINERHELMRKADPDLDRNLNDDRFMVEHGTEVWTAAHSPTEYYQDHSEPMFETPFDSLNEVLDTIRFPFLSKLYWIYPKFEEHFWNYLPGASGITQAWFYVKACLTGTGFHIEDMALPSVNINLGPYDNLWFVVVKRSWPRYLELCADLRRRGLCAHCFIWKNPSATLELLRSWEISYVMYRQKAGQMMFVSSCVPHMVMNCGISFSAARNVITPGYIESHANFASHLFRTCKHVANPLPRSITKDPRSYFWNADGSAYSITKLVKRMLCDDEEACHQMDEAALRGILPPGSLDQEVQETPVILREWEKANSNYLLGVTPFTKGDVLPTTPESPCEALPADLVIYSDRTTLKDDGSVDVCHDFQFNPTTDRYAGFPSRQVRACKFCEITMKELCMDRHLKKSCRKCPYSAKFVPDAASSGQ